MRNPWALYYRYKYSTCRKVAVPTFIGVCHIVPYTQLHEVAWGTAITYSLVNYSCVFLDQYIETLDKWREAEARYEEKTDPPEFDWKVSLEEHNPKLLSVIHELTPYKQVALVVILVEIFLVLRRGLIFDTLESFFSFLIDFLF